VGEPERLLYSHVLVVKLEGRPPSAELVDLLLIHHLNGGKAVGHFLQFIVDQNYQTNRHEADQLVRVLRRIPQRNVLDNIYLLTFWKEEE